MDAPCNTPLGPLPPQDHDTIERATLSAVAPQRIERWRDWLIPFDDSTIGRAHSATPLWQATADAGLADTLARIAQRYRQAGHLPRLRLPDHPHFAALTAAARAQGWQPTRPTDVQVADAAEVLARAAALSLSLAQGNDGCVQLQDRATPDWQAVYLGPGFDPVDGASRMRNLCRSALAGNAHAALGASGRTGFASVLDAAGGTLAVGAAHRFAAAPGGWVGVHGMRTRHDQRRRGHATRLIAAMARAAQQQGAAGLFLQVEADNHAAQAAYARLGFSRAWAYRYWQLAPASAHPAP